MKCEVIDIFFPKGNDLDHLVHLKVIDSKIDDNKKFLSREAMR